MEKFDITGATVVITSSFVVNDNMPILYVSHEYDNEDGVLWQFHCGNDDYDMKKMFLVSLKNIIELDDSILEVSNLPLNFIARRKYIGGKWVYSKE